MKFKNSGWTERWWNDYNSLSDTEKAIANQVIYTNKFDNIKKYKNNKRIYNVLNYYTINKEVTMEILTCK